MGYKESFIRSLDDIADFDDDTIDRKLEEILNGPMSCVDDYSVLFYGVGILLKRAGLSKEDGRVQKTIYERSINLLQSATADLYYVVDYVISTMGRFGSDLIPKEYGERLISAAESCYTKIKKDEGTHVKRLRDWIDGDFEGRLVLK